MEFSDDLIGALIPSFLGNGSKYRIIRKLGKGGMGVVFEAINEGTGVRVALKVLSTRIGQTAISKERFRQEGRLASTLSHPRCVFVLEADEDDDGRPFIAMELMTGDTLQDLVEKGGPLAIGDAVTKILDVIDGLREAHRLGLIHRDVKPSNCFLDGDGRVKVGDFGLSKSQAGSAQLTRTGAFLGTPLYASPEQIKVDALDGRTDVYSTAATLFFLLTGRAPFDRGDASATMARIVTDPAPSPRQIRPRFPTVSIERSAKGWNAIATAGSAISTNSGPRFSGSSLATSPRRSWASGSGLTCSTISSWRWSCWSSCRSTSRNGSG